MPVDAPRVLTTGTSGSVLVFERCGQVFCSPVEDVREIVEEPKLFDPGPEVPLIASILSHDGQFIPVVDPAAIVGRPSRPEGDVVLIEGPQRTVGVFADHILGFRQPVGTGLATWIPENRFCRRVAMLEEIGRAFILAADGLGDVPTAERVAPAATELTTTAVTTPLHLVYGIGERFYASAYVDVVRILFRQPMFRIPGGRPPLVHVVEMTGSVVPVVELDEGIAERPHFVVLASPIGPLALRVDTIARPLALVRDAADPDWFPSPGVAGIGRAGEREIPLVTGEALLRDLMGGVPA